MNARTDQSHSNDRNTPPPPIWKTPKFWKWAAGIVTVLVLLTFVIRWNRSDDKKDQVAETTNGTAGQATVTIPLAEYEQLKADAAQGKTAAAAPRVPQPGQIGAMPMPIPGDQCLYEVLGATRSGYTIVDSPDGKSQIVTNVLSVDVRPKQ